jgi:hypothetical protein
MSTISITEELLSLDTNASDYRRERMRLMVKYLQAYMNTYDKQHNYKGYTDETFIEDVLYGLGVAIDPENHQWADGLKRWKETLCENHLKK